MLIFKWDERLETGIELIDRQHKNILNEANVFFVSYKCGTIQAKLAKYLSFLEQYVMYHFQAEEALQAKFHYPALPQHQAQHQALKMQLKFHTTTLLSCNFSREQVDLFYDFMCKWVVEHVLSEDMQFAAHCRTHPTLLAPQQK